MSRKVFIIALAAIAIASVAVAGPLVRHSPKHVDTSAIFAPVLEKAKNGDATSQYVIGMRYERGQDVKQSFAEANGWFRKAADQGLSMAELKLGEHYQYGRGFSVNLTEAAKWYEKAAAQDNFTAQHALGKLYFSGDGVKQDFVEGYFWLSLAATEKLYAPDRDRAAVLLKPDQIATARSRVEKWRADKAHAAGKTKTEKKG